MPEHHNFRSIRKLPLLSWHLLNILHVTHGFPPYAMKPFFKVHFSNQCARVICYPLRCTSYQQSVPRLIALLYPFRSKLADSITSSSTSTVKSHISDAILHNISALLKSAFPGRSHISIVFFINTSGIGFRLIILTL